MGDPDLESHVSIFLQSAVLVTRCESGRLRSSFEWELGLALKYLMAQSLKVPVGFFGFREHAVRLFFLDVMFDRCGKHCDLGIEVVIRSIH